MPIRWRCPPENWCGNGHIEAPATCLDDTYIIAVSDNGTTEQALGPPYRPGVGKATLYQGGIHVPLIIRPPDETKFI